MHIYIYFRRPRSEPGGPFSWICRQVQCFQMILVTSVVLGGLGEPFSRICRQVQCFRRCCRAKCSKTQCFRAPSHSGAADSSIQCLRRWICRQVQCFRRPFSRICRQVRCFRRPRSDPGDPFSWICRQVQCFRAISVISVISVVLGGLG